MKLQLPIRQHVQLHSLRVLTDLGLSDVVERAVDNYLELIEDSGDVDTDQLGGSDLGG